MPQFQDKVETILAELESILTRVQADEVDGLVEAILASRVVVVAGAGRVGMAARGFAMRLGHLGRAAYALGDATVPSIGAGDLLLVASGSGETQTIYDVAAVAKRSGAQLALVTGRRDSRMGGMADVLVELPAPSKVVEAGGTASVQPLTTLNEQALQIFFDAVVLELMDRTNESSESMWRRHSVLE